MGPKAATEDPKALRRAGVRRRTRALARLWNASSRRGSKKPARSDETKGRARTAALFLAASSSVEKRKARRALGLGAPAYARLVRLDPATTVFGGGESALHLIDTTMMYAPRSGGVKRYLTAKRAWLERHRGDIRHTLVVPGAHTRADGPGMVTVAAARLPFGDGYRMPASVNKWETVLKVLAPDVIEAGDVFVPGHAALEAGEALAVPVVGFCHTDAAALAALHLGDWAEAPTFNFWAQAYSRFDQVVAPSWHTASRLAEAGVERVSVHPLGVDTEIFHPGRGDRARLVRRLGLPADARLLVFAGRPAREKNVDSMIEAVEKLGDPYHLVLVGAGTGSKPSPRVFSLDFEREPQRLAAIIASCDAFLHGNENEIFGLVVLEAMAAGLPVIGPNKGGVGELIDEAVGQRAASSDPADLAQAIEALFARDVEAISHAARLRAETRHSWDRTFEGLTKLYADLIGRQPRTPLALTA